MATQVPISQTQPVEAPTLEVLPSEVPASTEPPVIEEIFDGRISIMTTSVEMTTDPLANCELPASSDGNQYISFRLTVPRIEDIHLLNIMGFEEERPTLQLADGQIYEVLFSQLRVFSLRTQLMSQAHMNSLMVQEVF